MRCLHPDAEYFRFLDAIGGESSQHPSLAAMMLAHEFPTLRAEEARAVYCDWRRSEKPRQAAQALGSGAYGA